MSAIWSLATKDLRLMLRDPMGLFWIVGFPTMLSLFFGSLFGGQGDPKARALTIAVADEDGTPESRSFVERLERSDSLVVTRAEASAARDSVRLGRLTGYVRIKPGFAETPLLFGGGDAGKGLEIGMDPARKAESGYLQGILMQALFEDARRRFTDPLKMRDWARKGREDLGKSSTLPAEQKNVYEKFFGGLDEFLRDVDPKEYADGSVGSAPMIEPVAVEARQTRPASSFEISFPQGIMWGLLACAATFGISLVVERAQGTWLRLRLAPLSRAQILGGKALACFLTCLGVTLALLLLGALFCGVRLRNPVGLAIAVPSCAACFTGMMMFTSVLGKTEQSVSGAGWGINTILAMLGGGMVPLFLMPAWLRPFSHFSPVKWSILALEGAIWRDFTLAEIVAPCAVLLAFGAGFLLLGLWRFGRLERA